MSGPDNKRNDDRRSRLDTHPAQMNQNAEFYEAFAPFYEQVYGCIDANEAVRQWLLLLEDLRLVSAKDERIASPIRLLDIGCGPGWYLGPWAEAGFDVAGIDASPGMLGRAAHCNVRNGGAKPFPLHLADIRAPQGVPGLEHSFDIGVAHFNFLNLFAPSELALVFAGTAHFVRAGGLWVTDYSCPHDPLSDIEESYSEGSRGADLLRKGRHDTNHNCYRLHWQGANLDSEEVYWFHSASEYVAAAGQTGWKVLESFEWRPDQTVSPWKPASSASERIVSILRRA